MGINKVFITPKQLWEDSCKLSKYIFDSGAVPSKIVGLWRGGAPVGITVQESLAYRGINTDHISVRTSAYEPDKIDEKATEIVVYNLGYLVDTVNQDDTLLIIDDVWDTGRTVKAFKEELKRRTRANFPKNILVGTIYFKPEKNVTEEVPKFFVYKTDSWLVFPHEFEALSEVEIIVHKGPKIAKDLGIDVNNFSDEVEKYISQNKVSSESLLDLESII